MPKYYKRTGTKGNYKYFYIKPNMNRTKKQVEVGKKYGYNDDEIDELERALKHAKNFKNLSITATNTKAYAHFEYKGNKYKVEFVKFKTKFNPQTITNLTNKNDKSNDKYIRDKIANLVKMLRVYPNGVKND